MDRPTFRKQIEASVTTARAALARTPNEPRALFMADLIARLGAADTDLRAAAARYAAWRDALGSDGARAVLRDQGMLEFLRRMWQGLAHEHYDGAELLVFADALIELTTEAKELSELPYAVGNWVGSWSQVGRTAARACERLAAAALARDPDDEGALWLYAQPDFRARTRTKGPPVPRPSLAQALAKVERIVSMHESGAHHPLEVPSLDTIAVDHPAVVRALANALERLPPHTAGRAGVIEAIARGAEADRERALGVLRALLAGGAWDAEHASMVIHYEMKGRAPELLDALVACTERLLAKLDRRDECDYRHQWPLRAVLSVLPHAEGAARAAGIAFVERLLAERASMPEWRRERLHELALEGPPLLLKLARAARRSARRAAG